MAHHPSLQDADMQQQGQPLVLQPNGPPLPVPAQRGLTLAIHDPTHLPAVPVTPTGAGTFGGQLTPMVQQQTLVQQLHLHHVQGDYAMRNISPDRLRTAEMNHVLVQELQHVRQEMLFQEAHMQEQAVSAVEHTRARAEQALQEQRADFQQSTTWFENTARQVTETELRDYQRDAELHMSRLRNEAQQYQAAEQHISQMYANATENTQTLRDNLTQLRTEAQSSNQQLLHEYQTTQQQLQDASRIVAQTGDAQQQQQIVLQQQYVENELRVKEIQEKLRQDMEAKYQAAVAEMQRKHQADLARVQDQERERLVSSVERKAAYTQDLEFQLANLRANPQAGTTQNAGMTANTSQVSGDQVPRAPSVPPMPQSFGVIPSQPSLSQVQRPNEVQTSIPTEPLKQEPESHMSTLPPVAAPSHFGLPGIASMFQENQARTVPVDLAREQRVIHGSEPSTNPLRVGLAPTQPPDWQPKQPPPQAPGEPPKPSDIPGFSTSAMGQDAVLQLLLAKVFQDDKKEATYLKDLDVDQIKVHRIPTASMIWHTVFAAQIFVDHFWYLHHESNLAF